MIRAQRKPRKSKSSKKNKTQNNNYYRPQAQHINRNPKGSTSHNKFTAQSNNQNWASSSKNFNYMAQVAQKYSLNRTPNPVPSQNPPYQQRNHFQAPPGSSYYQNYQYQYQMPPCTNARFYQQPNPYHNVFYNQTVNQLVNSFNVLSLNGIRSNVTVQNSNNSWPAGVPTIAPLHNPQPLSVAPENSKMARPDLDVNNNDKKESQDSAKSSSSGTGISICSTRNNANDLDGFGDIKDVSI